MFRLHIENEKFNGWVKIVDNEMLLTEYEHEATQFTLQDAHAYIAKMAEYKRSTFLLKPVPRTEHYGKEGGQD